MRNANRFRAHVPLRGTPCALASVRSSSFEAYYRQHSLGRVALLTALLFTTSCSTGNSPAAPQTPQETFSVTGSVSERLEGAPLGGSTIKFTGPITALAQVNAQGRYEIHGLVSGDYDVSISSSAHVPHETRAVSLSATSELSFTVLRWQVSAFGAIYDDNFQRFFHQLARVGYNAANLRKWVIKPTEIYVVEGGVPAEHLHTVLTQLRQVNEQVVSALWCNWIGALPIRTGPDVQAPADGQIVVRPNWDTGASGSVGETHIRSGSIAINVYGPARNRLLTPQELRGVLAHELFHVAGAFHVCGGSLGDNPFGFSIDNCPYPDSLMANRGELFDTPSPQDRLASCVIYNPDTTPGNRFPDLNPYYSRR